MRSIGGVEHHLTVSQDGLGFAEVNYARGEQRDAGVAVLFVVPLEELLAERRRCPSQLAVIDPGESTEEAIGDWHYWIAQGYIL